MSIKLKALLTALLAITAPAAFAQSTVTPTVSNGEIVVPFTDPSGASHVVTIPYTVNLSVGNAVVTYTAPAPPPPPPPPPTGAPAVPSNAIAVDLVNPKNAWKNTKDAGTPGTATFSNNYPVTGPLSDLDRAFSIAYQGAAGVRFSNSFAKDTVATHFIYDTIVESPDWTHVANLELDINQVKADGHTAILGVQCSSYGHSWEVTKTNSTGSWSWFTTNLSCDPTKWTPNAPHHIRIFGIMDASEVSTYVGVELDGTYGAFTGESNMTGRALGWSVGSVLPNFQIDGLGQSGTATIYTDKLTIIRW